MANTLTSLTTNCLKEKYYELAANLLGRSDCRNARHLGGIPDGVVASGYWTSSPVAVCREWIAWTSGRSGRRQDRSPRPGASLPDRHYLDDRVLSGES